MDCSRLVSTEQIGLPACRFLFFLMVVAGSVCWVWCGWFASFSFVSFASFSVGRASERASMLLQNGTELN